LARQTILPGGIGHTARETGGTGITAITIVSTRSSITTCGHSFTCLAAGRRRASGREGRGRATDAAQGCGAAAGPGSECVSGNHEAACRARQSGISASTSSGIG